MPAPVTIAIVSWNTCELLHQCLTSMQADAGTGLADVWVVDNGSTDGSQAMVRERHPWATVLEPGDNLGYGPAVNAVGRRTRGEWIVASNADVVLEPGALGELLERAEAAGPRLGVAGPRLILPDGSTQAGVQPFPSVSDALLRHSSAYKLAPGLGSRLCLAGRWDPGAPAAVDWLTGAFLLMRRTAWDEIGGFDEGQWMYAEDLDLCWRAHRAGWAVRYEPSARVRHELSPATGQAFGDADRRAERIRRADYAWLRRRQGRTRAAAVALVTVTALGARVGALAALRLRWPDRFDGSHARSVRLLRRELTGVRAALEGGGTR